MVLTLHSIFLMASSGLCAGFLTGLVSLGGAFIIVPTIYYLLNQAGVNSQAAFTTAIATSLAFVLFSSLSASFTYAKKKMIDKRLLFIVCFGAIVGLVLGIKVVMQMDEALIRNAFGIFIWLLGGYLLTAKYFKWGKQYGGELPLYTTRNLIALFVVGGGVGFLVAAFGIGGGGIIAPAIALITQSDMKRAIATGVGATVIISIVGVSGYILMGINHPETLSLSIGWIYLPALIILIPCALMAAPIGAKVSLHLTQPVLMSILALSMFLMGTNLLFF